MQGLPPAAALAFRYSAFSIARFNSGAVWKPIFGFYAAFGDGEGNLNRHTDIPLSE
jgi:hypothetical protein